jgi:metal-responsive CopG/Arc/MetJ family transcriptional regulator
LHRGGSLSYFSSMKQKTSITLSPEVLRAVDAMAGASSNRSRIIEQALVEFLERRRRAQREARDLAILEAAADELNREIEDVLDYQAEL